MLPNTKEFFEFKLSWFLKGDYNGAWLMVHLKKWLY